jgi:hypothetical protein
VLEADEDWTLVEVAVAACDVVVDGALPPVAEVDAPLPALAEPPDEAAFVVLTPTREVIPADAAASPRVDPPPAPGSGAPGLWPQAMAKAQTPATGTARRRHDRTPSRAETWGASTVRTRHSSRSNARPPSIDQDRAEMAWRSERSAAAVSSEAGVSSGQRELAGGASHVPARASSS